MPELLPEDKGSAKLSFWRTVRVVAWAFVGLRNRNGHKQDMAQVKPVHVIVVGVLAVLFLVLTLVFLVNTVLAA